MMSMDSGDDLDVGLGYDDVAHGSVSLKTKFWPWHKPRKQYIRNKQWNTAAANLIDHLRLKEKGRSLQYLSLPGSDLLDVRSLYTVCAAKEVRLKFIGLNEITAGDKEATMDQLISINELHGLQYIDPSSDVYEDQLERLCVDKSIAQEHIIKRASSYDVINIDLCRSMLESPPQEKQSNYYDALFKLLRHQADNRTEDWLFFVTTRTNQDMVHEGAFRKFVEALEQIFDLDEAVYNKCNELEIFGKEVLVERRIDVNKVDAPSYNNLVSAGIGKWVLSALAGRPPAHKSKMLQLFGYNVVQREGDACDMMSFGFWCKHIPNKAVDAFGLAGAGANLNAEDVAAAVSRARLTIVESVSKLINVDVHMADDDVFEEMLHSSTSLMKSARYDIASYVDWARDDHGKVKSWLASRGIA
ncbi:PP_RS20740 family protein [Pseudomonas sp. LB3P25]